MAKKYSAISTLDPFNKSINEYTRTVGSFLQQSLHALVLVPNLKSATTDIKRKAVLKKAKELKVPEHTIRLSVLNGIDACVAVRDLDRVERLLIQEVKGAWVDERFRQSELDVFMDTMRAWAAFCYPDQILPKEAPTKPRHKGKRRLKVTKIDAKDA